MGTCPEVPVPPILDHDPIGLNRIMISFLCANMISEQTLRIAPWKTGDRHRQAKAIFAASPDRKSCGGKSFGRAALLGIRADLAGDFAPNRSDRWGQAGG